MPDFPTISTTAEQGDIPRLVKAKRLVLAVLDLVLPGVDSIDPMRALPVIFVSVYGGGDTIVCPLAGGAADYIVKPYSPAELAVRPVRLTATEYKLLHGGATTYETLQRRVWGPGKGRPTGGQERRHQAPPQARRQHLQPALHPRLPHAGARQSVRAALPTPAALRSDVPN